MAVFIVRRLIVSFFILLVSTFLVYLLVAVSGDPLEDLYQDQSSTRDQKIAQRIDRLNLDVPVHERYVGWLAGTAKCVTPWTVCDLGQNRNGQDVAVLLTQAAGSTLKLVTTATVLAIVVGVMVGIVSALRQYSGFDYTVTFAAFLFFSLPIFWVAVLLKQYGAIRVNNWLAEPTVGPVWIVGISLAAALFWAGVIGGERRHRLIAAAVGGGATAAVLIFISATQWFRAPGLGPVLVAVLSLAAAAGATVLVADLDRRRVLYSALGAAVAVVVASFLLAPVLAAPTGLVLAGLFGAALAAGAGIGFAVGGLDRDAAIKAGLLASLSASLLVFADYALQALPEYSSRVNGRIIATIGSNTPNFQGGFWVTFLDTATHLVLPTLALILISFATYTRYTRSSMLEVMNQDYVRTARSKGLTERTVVMRHAFRNALIPVTTLMAFDFGGLIGGAIITEQVFGWRGMGALFIQGLREVDPNPVMGFYLITAVALVVFNMIADIAYAYLDPRIRLS